MVVVILGYEFFFLIICGCDIYVFWFVLDYEISFLKRFIFIICIKVWLIDKLFRKWDKIICFIWMGYVVYWFSRLLIYFSSLLVFVEL